MIPDKHQPVWRDLVTGKEVHAFKSIPGGMLMTRLVSKCKIDSSKECLLAAIDEAHAFFVKYKAILKEDIENLFGKEDGCC